MPDLTPEKLERFTAELAAVQDSAAAETVTAVRRFFGNYIARVEQLLNQTTAIPEAELISVAEQQAILTDLEGILELAGFDDVIETYEEQLAKINLKTVEFFEVYGNGQTLSGISAQNVDLLASDFADDLLLNIDNALVKPISNQIRNSMITAVSREQAVREITNVINPPDGSLGILRRDGKFFTNANIEVFINDSGRRFSQLVKNEKAKDSGLEIVVFTNPIDAKTRPQCVFMATEAPHGVPGMWYKEEFTTDLHENLTESPLVARGGWNCRGQVDFVDLDYAKELGFKP